MTVGELKKLLERFDDDEELEVSSTYGDYASLDVKSTGVAVMESDQF